MNVKEFVLHRADINNNCPKCFSASGMVFSFIQNQKENNWVIITAKEIHEELFCQNCSQVIYPGLWDKAIERVYAYQKKCFSPMSYGIRLKKKAKTIIGLGVLTLLLGISLWVIVRNGWL